MEYVIGKTLAPVTRRQPGSSTQSWWAILDTWHERYAQRRALLQLDGHLLDDIGLTSAEARAEALKPFWVA